MMSGVNRLFRQYCPKCKEPLSSNFTILKVIKSCTVCKYREEAYPALGIRITYEDPAKHPTDTN